jgi:hypothetical protein
MADTSLDQTALNQTAAGRRPTISMEAAHG